MADLFDNPMGLMGFEFVEFASPAPNVLEPLFEKMGFTLVARHRSKDVLLYRQGDINFIVNREPKSLAGYFAAEHGPSACALAFRVRDSHKAYARALELGAQPIEVPTGPMELRLPAIKGIGGAPLYLIDRFEDGKSIYDIDFEWLPGRRAPSARARLQDRRPPDAQRVPRAHGVLGQLLREDLQLPRDPLLRHQGRIHRPDQPRDDRARRPDPHPAERGVGQGRHRPDRGIPDEVQRRGHPAHRAADRRPDGERRRAADGRRAADERAERRLLRDARGAPARPRRAGERAAGARHPARRHRTAAGRRRKRAAAADFFARRCSARCSSSSSSARTTRASAKATSRRCSNRSSATSFGAAR